MSRQESRCAFLEKHVALQPAMCLEDGNVQADTAHVKCACAVSRLSRGVQCKLLLCDAGVCSLFRTSQKTFVRPFVRPSVPRQKSKSPLKPYKSSQDHARTYILLLETPCSSVRWSVRSSRFLPPPNAHAHQSNM